jgi:hypothetical protein
VNSVYRQRYRMRIDWFRVLADLERLGMNNRSIARHLGIPKSTIAYWKAGNDPRHSDGEHLIELWCETVHKPREGLPIRDTYAWP